MQKYLRNKRDESIYHTEKAAQPAIGLRRLTLYGLLLVDTVSYRISAEAHSGDLHDGRDHLALSIDKLGRVLAVLDEVLPIIVHSAPDLSEGYLAGDIGKGDHKDDGLPLSLRRRCRSRTDCQAVGTAAGSY